MTDKCKLGLRRFTLCAILTAGLKVNWEFVSPEAKSQWQLMVANFANLPV